jgi:hypothetical protein
MWQTLYWRNRQTSSRAARRIYARSQKASSREGRKLAQLAYEETYGIACGGARILQIETNSRKEGKYKDSGPHSVFDKTGQGSQFTISSVMDSAYRQRGQQAWACQDLRVYLLIFVDRPIEDTR